MSYKQRAKDTPGANTAATSSISADANHAIEGIMVWWSYNSTPTGGNLVVQADGVTVVNVDVTSGGPGFLPLNGIVTDINQSLSATLAAGGGGISGKVNIAGKLK